MKTLRLTLSVWLLALPLCLHAQVPAPAGAADPAVVDLLMKSQRAYKEIPSLYMESLTTSTVSGIGQNINTHISTKMWKSGSDKFYLLMQMGQFTMAIISDGQNMLTYIPMLKQYTLKPLNKETVAKDLGSQDMMIAQIFGEVSEQEVREQAARVQLLGNETLGGIATKKLRMTSDTLTVDMWMTDTERPLMKRMEMNMDMGTMRMFMVSDSKWIEQPIPDSHFQIQPPADATQVAELNMAAMAQQMAAGFAGAAGAPAPGTANTPAVSPVGTPASGGIAPNQPQ